MVGQIPICPEYPMTSGWRFEGADSTPRANNVGKAATRCTTHQQPGER